MNEEPAKGRRRRDALPAALVLLLSLLLGCCTSPAAGSVPADLTNFQNEYPCDPNATLIVRPRTLDDVAEAVGLHDHIMTSGEGHSWNQPFFCVTPGAALDAATAAAVPAGNNTSSSSGGLPVLAAGRRRLQQQQLPGAPPATTPAAGSTSNSTYIPAPSVLPRPSSANIAMTTLRPLNISVDKAEQAVWVDAGVKTIDLLDYLRNAVSPAAPAGWTLGAFPWFVYQTIAGAVATNTHGSSLAAKSLSNQVLALDVILANGSRRIFANETDPFLMRAWRVSVGKLGIIGRVRLAITREVPVQRVLKSLSPPGFLALMQEVSAAWDNGAGSPPVWLNETEFFWVTQKHQFMMVSYHRADAANSSAARAATLAGYKPDNTTVFQRKADLLALGELVLPADAALSINASQIVVASDASGNSTTGSAAAAAYARAQQWLDGFVSGTINRPVPAAAGDAPEARTKGARWTLPKPKMLSSFYGAENMAEGLMEVSRLGIQTVAGNSSAEPSSIYIKQPASTLPQLQATLYDQYEVSIPLAAAGSCWARLLQVVYAGDLMGTTNATHRALDKGFRTAPLIRFIGHEDGLLSLTHDGPRMFVNIEDYLFYNRNRRVNARFREVMALLTGDAACTSKGPPRLHWGKAGWPDPGCFRGDERFGDNWCHFGCAVRALDPAGKFADASSGVWTWQGVDLEACCGPDGFSAGCECKVQHARSASECPPPPFYTTR